MLVVVCALVFGLGFLLDFFEIAFVLVPILAPVAQTFGIDLIWFGVLLCVNLQTSFMTPPFGYALFFLRGVAPREDSIDRDSGRTIPGVSSADIAVGSLPFVAVPVLVMAALIAFPQLVLWDDGRGARLPDDAVLRILDAGRSAPGGSAAKPDPGDLLEEELRRER